MSPDLKQGDLPQHVHVRKFVRVDRRIYYANEAGDDVWHSDLAHEIGIKPDEMDKFLVDDAGMLFNEDEKITFGGFTRSCKIKGDFRKAREETEKIAKEILGEDKVY